MKKGVFRKATILMGVQNNLYFQKYLAPLKSNIVNSSIILFLALLFSPCTLIGQTIQKYKGDFPDPNKTQNGIAVFEYIEDTESHERIKNGLFVYDFKGVGDYEGFNQNISGTFKDGKREGVWNFSVTMTDFGVKNPYYTGMLKAKTSYNNGKPEGIWTYSYTYKKRNQVYSYGTLKWGEFSADTKTEVSYSFREGQLCGPVKIIDNANSITIDGTVAENGILDGKWTIVDNLKGTTKVVEYRNSILFDSYTRNISGEIIKRISPDDKKRFEEISEIKKMTEEQRLDAGVKVDTIRTGFINDWCFELASYTNVFYEPTYFMPKSIGGELGFDGLKEIVITRERRTPLNEVYEYNSSNQYFENGNYNMAFIMVQKIISDPWIFNTLSRTDKNKVESFFKTCNDSVSALIKRSLTNIPYLNNLEISINDFGQEVLNSNLWKSNPFIIRGGYYDGQTSTHNGNWFNRDGKELWSQLRGYYPIWTQFITDNFLGMKEAVDADSRNKEIVNINFNENGIYNAAMNYTYDIRDSSSFLSKSLLKDYYKSIELFSLLSELDSLRRDVDSVIESYDDKSITKAFQRIKEYYTGMLANINTIDLLLSKFNFEKTSYENIYKYLKSSDKDSLKVLLKKSNDIPNFIDAMKN